jgi:uncharacterized membrane-anchored protein
MLGNYLNFRKRGKERAQKGYRKMGSQANDNKSLIRVLKAQIASLTGEQKKMTDTFTINANRLSRR